MQASRLKPPNVRRYSSHSHIGLVATLKYCTKLLNCHSLVLNFLPSDLRIRPFKCR